jgi:anaerobic magnesium-protoporphyrin IX monomethyl ester cyclase
MADVILINPAYSNIIYKNAKIKAGVPLNPLLNLALLARPVIEAGYEARILDLNIGNNSDSFLGKEIRKEKPRFAGITSTTPLYPEAKRLAQFIKEISPDTVLIIGGAHGTTFPEEVLKDSAFDIVAMGEGDFIMRDLLTTGNPGNIKGLVFKENGGIVNTGRAGYIKNLDELPLPAWDLYDLDKYDKYSLSNRKSPPGYLETSRGCPWGCVFCNKNIHGRKFRPKTAERVVDEIEYMLKSGFKEINILDDTFSTDLDRIKSICDKIMRRGLRFPWHPLNGMRVDRADKELFIMMKKAGCYKVSFGIESGNQDILDKAGKGINLQQVRDAVSRARQLGFETFGYFMIGLPGETEETLKDTINFANELKLDMAKFNIAVPLPGTEIFEEWDRMGLIKTKDWSKYNFYSPHYEIYEHPELSHRTIAKYYKRAYRSFYFSPFYLIRRFVRGLKDGILLRDIQLFLQTNWLN